MKTVTYQDIQNAAAEIAGRTRDKLPVKEQLMVQNFLAGVLREVWNGQFQWPELVPAILPVALNGANFFSKNEGQAGELGDVLGVWTADPTATSRYLGLRFEEGDNVVRLPDGGQATVYVEYMLPCPDLNSMNGNTLLNFLIPARFRQFLAWAGAGHLCRADGQVAQGDEFIALAQSEVVTELKRVTPVPRRPIRMKDLYVDAAMFQGGQPQGQG